MHTVPCCLWINSVGEFLGMGDTASQLFGIELGGWGGKAEMMKSINHSVSRVKLFVGRQNLQ